MTNTVAFPGLGIGPFTFSKGFSFFGISIHWYGVIIALGIVLAYLFGKKKAFKREISQDTVLDIIIWGLPSAVIFARLYYVIFSWDDYKGNLMDIFKIWEGGIAIYGGVIGATLSSLIYCRIKKVPIGKMFDVGAFGLLIGQMVGRWGNFVNGEAFGGLTDTALFRMTLVNRNITVHPTFLYESFWNLLVFLFLNWYEKKQKFDGEIFLLYLSGYGLGRFFIEGMREDSLWLGSVRISQVLAAICFIAGVILVLYFRIKKKREINSEN